MSLPNVGAALPGAAPAAGAQKAAAMTPLQLEVLEASFTINAYPSDELRRTLAERIGLTTKDIQTWFTNRRRKEKRKEKAAEKAAALAAGGAGAAGTAGQQAGGSRAATPPAAAALQSGSAPASPWRTQPSGGLPPRPPSGQALGQQQRGAAGLASQQAADEGSADDEQEGPAANGAPEEDYATLSRRLDSYKPLLEAAKATLPVPFRNDGPPLGFEFDPVPPDDPNLQPDNEGNEGAKRRRIVLDDMIAEAGEDGITGFKRHKPSGGGWGGLGVSTSELEAQLEAQHAAELAKAQAAREEAEAKLARESEKVANTEAMLAAAVGAEAERLRQQLARQQEQLVRARAREEEERRREAERIEAVRRRQLEHLSKERAKADVKRSRELEKLRQVQEREAKKLEAKRERERKAEERKKAAEDKKREKEMARALAQQERSGLRLRHREAASGPPDDLDLEWEKLTEAARAAGYASDTEGTAAPPAAAQIVRPEFPPPALALEPAFPDDLGQEAGAELLCSWGFCHTFRGVLGLPPFSVDELLAALVAGSGSALLGALHVAMIRVLQADMEDAHASGALQAGGTMNFLDRAVITHAAYLEEAWAWGFDVDALRAHLGPLTWPEATRQLAIVCGLGPKRPKVKENARDKLGAEGEDVVGVEGDKLKLRMPVRFGEGSAKAAAWRVLSRADHRGLTMNEIVRQVQRKGLRDLSGSKTPEASLAGALSRDVLFCRVKPSTYALTAVVNHHAAMEARAAASAGPAPGGWAVAGAVAGTEGAPAGPAKEAAAGAVTGSGLVLGKGLMAMGGKGLAANGGAAAVKHEGREAAVKSGQEAAVKSEVAAAALPVIKAEAVESASPVVKAEAVESASPMDVDGTPKQEQQEQQEEQTPSSGDRGGRGDANVEVVEGEAAGAGAAAPEEDGFSDEEGEVSEEEDEGQQLQGVPWVRGLASGGYDALPLPERITVLGWLCQATCESMTVRACLERRGEESQRLRRQLFEEARAEKKRRQDEQAARAQAAAQAAARKLQELQRRMIQGEAVSPDELAAVAAEAAGDVPGKAEGPEAQKEAEEEAAAEKLRRAARAEAIAVIDETHALRFEPLGCDRRHNRYWRLASGGAAEPGAGRIWVEYAGGEVQHGQQGQQEAQEQQQQVEQQDGQQGQQQQLQLSVAPAHVSTTEATVPDGARSSVWKLLRRPEQLDVLRGALEPKGAREGELFASLVRHEGAIRAAMPAPPLEMPSDAGMKGISEDRSAWLRSSSCLASTSGSDRSSSSTSTSTSAALAAKHQQQQAGDMVAVLRRDMLRFGQRVEEEGLSPPFDRHTWAAAVSAAPDLQALRRCLGQLESVLVPAHVSRVFPSTPNLVRGAWLPTQLPKPAQDGTAAEAATAGTPSRGSTPLPQQQAGTPLSGQQQQQQQSSEPLAWLPATAAALALRLATLDAHLVGSKGGPPAREVLAGYRYTVRPVPLPPPPSLEQIAAAAKAREQQGQQQQQQQQEQQEQQQRGGLVQQLLPCRVMHGPPLVSNGRQRLLMFPPFFDQVLSWPSVPFQVPAATWRTEVQAAIDDGSFHAAPTKPPPPPRASAAKRGGLTIRGARGGGRGRGGKRRAEKDAGSDDDWERNRDERPVTPLLNPRGGWGEVASEGALEGSDSDIDAGAKDDADDPDFYR